MSLQTRSKKSSRFTLPDTTGTMQARFLLIFAVASLTIIGLIMVYSASSIDQIYKTGSALTVISKQVPFAIGGALLCYGVAKFVPFDMWEGRLAWISFALCMALLILVAAIGTSALGAQRWVNIGPVSLQPSEFAKIAYCIIAARITGRFINNECTITSYALYMVLAIVLPLGVLYVTQNDLGTTAIIMVGIIAVLLEGGIPLKVVVSILIVGIFFAALSSILTPFRSNRWSFINPWEDPDGVSYQLVHSLYAFADGGIFGVGLGNSYEKYQYLPEAQTDFVYSILGEEWGLVGAVLVLVLYLVFAYAGLKIARQASSHLGAMVAGSLTTMVVFQAFLNIGSVLGVAPTTGKPLPFLSNGGSSLLSSFLIVGIILSVSYQSKRSDVHEDRRRNLRLVTNDNFHSVRKR